MAEKITATSRKKRDLNLSSYIKHVYVEKKINVHLNNSRNISHGSISLASIMIALFSSECFSCKLMTWSHGVMETWSHGDLDYLICR